MIIIVEQKLLPFICLFLGFTSQYESGSFHKLINAEISVAVSSETRALYIMFFIIFSILMLNVLLCICLVKVETITLQLT
jgi:hypothetical protein